MKLNPSKIKPPHADLYRAKILWSSHYTLHYTHLWCSSGQPTALLTSDLYPDSTPCHHETSWGHLSSAAWFVFNSHLYIFFTGFLWSSSMTWFHSIRTLPLIQNSAAWLVFRLLKVSYTTPQLHSLYWLPSMTPLDPPVLKKEDIFHGSSIPLQPGSEANLPWTANCHCLSLLLLSKWRLKSFLFTQHLIVHFWGLFFLLHDSQDLDLIFIPWPNQLILVRRITRALPAFLCNGLPWGFLSWTSPVLAAQELTSIIYISRKVVQLNQSFLTPHFHPTPNVR